MGFLIFLVFCFFLDCILTKSQERKSLYLILLLVIMMIDACVSSH